jgi:hypothetical protein
MFIRLTLRSRGLVEPWGVWQLLHFSVLTRHMLVDERPLLVEMAFVANGVTAGQRSRLAHGRRPMRIVAVIALHQTLSDPVVIWFGKICLGRGVASVAQLGLVLDQ